MAQKESRGVVLLFLQPRFSMGLGGQRHAPAALPHWQRDLYPLYKRLGGGPQGRSGRVWKISPPTGFDSRTVRPYTDINGENLDGVIILK
jgi:hypothetical protein